MELMHEYIAIPIWKTEGLVVGQESPYIGSEDAVRVLVERFPDDPNPQWFNLEPIGFSIES